MTTKHPKTQTLVLKVADDFIKANPFEVKRVAKKKVGRPTVMTQETVRKLEYAFAYDCTVEEACIYAGISRESYYSFCRDNPEFSDRITVLRHTAIFVARKTIVEALSHDASLAMKYLERKRPQEFSLRTTLAHQTLPSATHKLEPKTEQAIDNVFALFEKAARRAEKQFVVTDSE